MKNVFATDRINFTQKRIEVLLADVHTLPIIFRLLSVKFKFHGRIVTQNAN